MRVKHVVRPSQMILRLPIHSCAEGIRGSFHLSRVIHHRVVGLPRQLFFLVAGAQQQRRENQGRQRCAQKKQVPGGQRDRDTSPISAR